jgi:integrin alpha 8
VKVIDISGSGVGNTTIKGQQAGEFYGNSLAAADVDGNGLEDLLVGAPHYTDYDDSDLKYEIGRVYIYYQDATSIGKSWSVLKGSSIGGRFGHAISSLGDVNGDGFNDVAISAPYEDHGNVYIYFGSASGLRSEPGQVISGNQFSLRAFGFSLAGKADVDGNGYADLAVGAYQSDAIVYLPASPVIRMTNLSLVFEPAQISLKSRDSQRLNEKGQVVFCSSLTFCLAYTGYNVRQSTTFNVSLDLDYKQTNIRRLFFLKDNLSSKSSALAVQKDVVQCNKEDVCVRPDIIDKLTPMDTQMAIQVVNDPLTADLPPVLDAFGPQSITNSIKIANNCGDDGVCVPDLELNAIA